MATWKVARSSKVCALSGRPLAPGGHVVTALFGAEEEVSEDKVRGTGFVRKDFLVDDADPVALSNALEGAYCVWKATLPPDTGHRAPRLDLAMARDLLERLVAEGNPDRASAAWTLAMLLVRKRQLILVGEKDDALVLRWPKTEATFRVPATVVAEAEMEQLEQELSRLFEV